MKFEKKLKKKKMAKMWSSKKTIQIVEDHKKIEQKQKTMAKLWRSRKHLNKKNEWLQ